MIGTAVTEAVADPDLRAALGEGLRAFDKAFEDRIRLAQQRGEIARAAVPHRWPARFVGPLFPCHPSALRRAACDARGNAEDGVRMICGAAAEPVAAGGSGGPS